MKLTKKIKTEINGISKDASNVLIDFGEKVAALKLNVVIKNKYPNHLIKDKMLKKCANYILKLQKVIKK